MGRCRAPAAPWLGGDGTEPEMALIPRLELRQGQALVMTPQLQQAIKLLQFSNLELVAYVEQELAENPLLEPDDEGGDGLDGAQSEAVPEGSQDDGADDETDPLEPINFAAADDPHIPDDADLDVDYDNLWNADSPLDAVGAGPQPTAFADWGSGGGGGFDAAGPSLEQTLSDKVSLRQHLTSQLSLTLDDPVDRLIGVHLIDMVDEAGYLVGDLAPVAALLDCGVERVEAALAKLQQFDPAGIFARSLAECLALQLRDRDRLDPAMQTLLDNLDLVAKRDLGALMAVCGVDADDMADMMAEIRALNPKPALAFDQVAAEPITPDVLIRPRRGGGWIIELNSDTLPRVLVNNHYYTQIRRAARSREDKQYISGCFQSANWLVKSLHQRATTILKVATEIVRQQDGFFAKGVQYLRPLVLRDIAEAIEMHESTVSRVTSNKYMATPRGIYELKYFFTPAISSSAGGEAHSSVSVRHRMKALIDAESPRRPLSDDKIVALLGKEGIGIARRTVAKYREAMRIPSSVQRRRAKASL